MTNVVQFPGSGTGTLPPETIDITPILSGLRYLFALNYIGAPAYHIATLIACKMRDNNALEADIQLVETRDFYIESDNLVIASGHLWDCFEIATALRELQAHAGLYSQTTKAKVMRADDPYSNFTDDIRRRRPIPELLSPDARVFFRWDGDVLIDRIDTAVQRDSKKREDSAYYASV